MEHTIIYKREGFYAAHPYVDRLADGRLVIAARVQPFRAHAPVGGWSVFVSGDEGETWAETDDPANPYNWPASSHREKLDRFVAIMPDGSYLCAGSIGHEEWPAQRREEAEQQGLMVYDHPTDDTVIDVGGYRMFAQRSVDGGRTWSRRQWVYPGIRAIASWRQGYARLADGTILIPVYILDAEGQSHNYVFRSADGGVTWRLLPTGIHEAGVNPNETALLEVSPGRVLSLSRTESAESGYLVQRWSDDGGLTWSHLYRTDIWGYPPHLLRLRDGRVLCTFGYRREPMGVRAVLSNDGGETWDTDHVVVLRDDGHTSDCGYPVSIQLTDGRVLSVYYIRSADEVTHVAATRWAA